MKKNKLEKEVEERLRLVAFSAAVVAIRREGYPKELANKIVSKFIKIPRTGK